MHDRDLKRLSRRKVLKLSPLAFTSATTFKEIRMPLTEAGLRFSDWVSAGLGAGRAAETFSDSMVARFEDFPYNYYDVLNPEVDLDSWTLTVEGEVARPADT